jgi:lipopolysaccharide/colanic/teichoic acid biosynthesis glycosyltransferase
MAKRALDVGVSLLGLLLLAPLFAVIAVLVLVDSGPPVFYRQVRVGRLARTFRILKFRTMHPNADAGGSLTVSNDPRVTRAGKFLRRHKLDELPQLVNVLAGDMSLVGPRPEVPEYVAAYGEEDRRVVLSVRPGLTDNASIEFRDESALLQASGDPDRMYREQILPKKLALYREYVSQAGMRTDLRIIIRTLRAIASGGP